MTYKLLDSLIIPVVNLPDATTSLKGIVKLAGDVAGTSTNITVISATGSGSIFTVNATAPTIQWETGTTSPTLSQADNTTNSATAKNLIVRAQNATGTTAIGGSLNLSSGSGTSSNGSINFQLAGTTAITVNSVLSTGVVHSNSSGALSSSTIVNTDVSSSAAIAGTKISPAFGAQTISTSSGITSPNIDASGATTLSVGVSNASAITIGSSGITTTIAGNLTIGGTTTTINSTTVDIADRVIHVNNTTGTVAVPSQITGISVHRGNTGSVDRDHAGLFWDETNSTFKAAFNTAGDNSTLGNYLSFYADTLGVGSGTGSIPTITSGNASPSSTPQNGSLYLKTNGVLYTYNSGWSTVSSSAFTAGGDLTGTASSQQVVSLTGATGTLPIATTGAIIQWATGTTSPTLKQVDNTTNSATAQTLTIQSQNATGTTTTGGNLNLTSGNGTSTAGNINLQIGGTTTASVVPNKFVHNKGLRRNVTSITANYTVITSDNLIAVGTLSGSITILLPAAPSTGDTYEVKDTAGTAATNNIIIDGNGNNVDGASTTTLDQNYISITLIFTATEWSIL